jgi:hypothetical protein
MQYAQESRTRERVANSFSELVEIALSELRERKGPFSIVCGPITTGGYGSVEENVTALKAVINHYVALGTKVFDQTIYEPTLWSLKDEWEKTHGKIEYCEPILEEFYWPIFKSDQIIRGIFLPDWESSYGARWEREKLKNLGIEISDLPKDFVDQLTK